MKTAKSLLVKYFLRPLSVAFKHPRFTKVALSGLDDKLAKYLDFDNGFFVELGANDGITQSNTYYLEKVRGWQGVLVEPLPHLYQQARTNRRRSQVFNYACVPFDYSHNEIEITVPESSLMSFVEGALHSEVEIYQQISTSKPNSVKKQRVATRTLTGILDECRVSHIDFLSLDVEGFEAEVLRGLDFERYRPTFMLIESRYREKIESLILPHYEAVDLLTYHDVLYRVKN